MNLFSLYLYFPVKPLTYQSQFNLNPYMNSKKTNSSVGVLKMKGLIYVAKCEVTGKYYVGQTIKWLAHRKKQHKREAERGVLQYKFYNAVRHYGWDSFQWEVLEQDIADIDRLNEREIYCDIEVHKFRIVILRSSSIS